MNSTDPDYDPLQYEFQLYSVKGTPTLIRSWTAPEGNGTTAVDATKKFIPKAKIRLFDNEAQIYQALRNGNVHAVVESAPRPAYEAAAYPDSLFVPFRGTFTKEPIGFVMRKGDFDTMAYFNAWITLKRDSGWLDDRYDYWFGTRDWAGLVE